MCIHPSPLAGSQWWLPRLSLSWLPWFGARALQRKYGTRSSTVVLVDAAGRMKVVERNLGDGNGGVSEESGSIVGDGEARVRMRQAERNTFEFCDV